MHEPAIIIEVSPLLLITYFISIHFFLTNH